MKKLNLQPVLVFPRYIFFTFLHFLEEEKRFASVQLKTRKRFTFFEGLISLLEVSYLQKNWGSVQRQTSRRNSKEHAAADLFLWLQTCEEQQSITGVLLAVTPVLQAVEAIPQTLGLHALSVT